MTVQERQKLEKKIVRQFVTDALKAGFRLAVSLERGWDLDEMVLGSRSIGEVMKMAFAGDECHIFLQPASGPTLKDDHVVSVGWVFCVMGEDGWDVISDYSANPVTESVLERALKTSEREADRRRS